MCSDDMQGAMQGAILQYALQESWDAPLYALEDSCGEFEEDEGLAQRIVDLMREDGLPELQVVYSSINLMAKRVLSKLGD